MFELLRENQLFFSYVIMSLYLLNVINFMAARDWNMVWYWASAFSITACVTWR